MGHTLVTATIAGKVDVVVGLLGPLRVLIGGRDVTPTAPKTKVLLARLALSPGRVVRADRLVDELWPELDPAGARRALHVRVAELRRHLREAGAPGLLRSQPPGYMLALDPGHVDVFEFDALVERARSEAETQPEAAALRLRTALDLWRGEPLADVDRTLRLQAEANRLAEARLAAAEESLAVELRCGRHSEVATEAKALIADHPLRERLWAHRIVGLYRCGRQADALAAFKDLRALLVGELGIEPSQELRDLELAVLRQDEALASPARPPVATTGSERARSSRAECAIGVGPHRPVPTGITNIVRQTIQHWPDPDSRLRHMGALLAVTLAEPRDAVHFAIAVEQRVELASRRRPLPAVRIGIDYSDGGRRAGELCGGAAAGEIVASARVAADVSDLSSTGRVPWSPLGSVLPPLPRRVAELAQIPLFGRATELTRWAERWSQAVGGRSGLVLVSGEAGIGKSHLVSGAAAVHATGALVLYGRCDGEPLAPYQPIRQALARHVESCPVEELVPVRVRDLVEVARLVPALADRHPLGGTGAALPPDEDRLRLFDAVAAFLDVAAEIRPVLLLIDDLQWADRGSLRLIAHLLGEPQRRLLVVATVRDTEESRDDVDGFVLGVRREGRDVEHIAVGGLGERALGELCSAPGDVVHALHDTTAGNPFFAMEIHRHLTETGALSADRVLTVPASVRAVIERRLEGLAASRQILEVAAVIGQQFTGALLGRAAAQPIDAVLDAIDPAVRAGIVKPGPRAGHFAFGHPLLRETLYAGLSAGRRQRLHLAVADALDTRADPATATHHLSQAGSVAAREQLVELATRAAAAAMAVGGHEEAARLHALAVTTAERTGLAPLARAELLIGLGEAQVLTGDPAGPRTLRAAAELAHAERSPHHIARAAVALAQEDVAIAYFNPELVGILQAGLEVAGQADSSVRARLLGRLAVERFLDPAGRVGVTEAVEEAVGIAERLGDPATLAEVLGNRRFYRWGPDHPAALLADGREMLRIARVSGDPSLAWRGRVSIASALFQLGDVDGATGEVVRVERDATALGRPRMQWWVTNARAVLATLHGDLAMAEELAYAAFRHGERTSNAAASGWLLIHLYALRWLQGRLGELAQPVRAYLDQFPAAWIARCAQPMIALESNDPSAARQLLDEHAADGFAAVPKDANWYPGMALLAEVAARLGERRHCETLRCLLEPHAGLLTEMGSLSGSAGPMARPVGLLAGALGHRDEAVSHLEAAVSFSERLGARPWLAFSLHDLAEVRLARGRPGDVERAAKLASKASAVAREVGMAGLLGRLASLPVPVS